MENTARNNRLMETVEEFLSEQSECEIIEFGRDSYQRDSLSENFVNEIEAWARHALASNGFADYL
jgi:NAD(P)H-dependent FMN reductase